MASGRRGQRLEAEGEEGLEKDAWCDWRRNTMEVKVHADILKANDVLARQNRSCLDQHGLYGVNMVG